MRLFTLGLGLVLFVVTGCFPKDKCTTEDGGVVDGSCLDTASDTSGEIDDSDDTTATETDTSGDTGDSDTDSGDTDTDTGTGSVDGDIDGYNSDVDCDDHNEAVHPDATEVCNGIDDNCDGVIDEGMIQIWYRDSDEDGYGDVAIALGACDALVGYVSDATDCDDGNAGVNPSATEVCNDVDDDCDGDVDEAGADGEETWYEDADGDGYGNPSLAVVACNPPPGYVVNADDCNDDDINFHPGAVESCYKPMDLNCDGSVGYSDLDGDSVLACEDCNDTEAAMYPGGTETCDGLDNDCNSVVDDAAIDALTWYADVDGDTYGDVSNTEGACSASAGYVSNATDCNDGNATVNPSATEVCNDVDDDCDGGVDEGSSDPHTFYADDDGDGFGDSSDSTAACTASAGYVSDSTDCDDGNAGVNPSATEVCNDVDDDCDGDVDEAGADGETVWYADADGDGYGDAATTANACTAPFGYVASSYDCDDGDAAINPGASDIAGDRVDSDCDGSDGVADRDSDGDPYITDCDDANAAIYTGAPETCDGVDNDCNGYVDEGVSTAYFEDVDGDGFGDPASSTEDCTMPSGFVLDATDCDDTRAWANPGIATDGDSSNDEYCWDTIDADCDGISGCWGGLTGSNLFGSMVLWNMEDPIGSGNVSGVTMVSGTAATSDCTTGNTDNCSAMLQGPGTWTVETDQSALSGSNMFCYVSLAAEVSSIPVTVSVYRGGTLLESVSHDTGTSWGRPVSEFGLVAPASAGTITMQFTIASSNAVWVDALDCRQ